MRRAAVLLGLLLCSGCSLPTTLYQIDEQSPPPELGRPVWVTAPAQVGSWVGGAVGGLVSVLALPVTWPISLVAEEPLGYSREEFLFAPVGAGAGLGHVTFGTPFDVLDYSFRRAWTHPEPLAGEAGYEKQKPPLGPGAADPAPSTWRERLDRVERAGDAAADGAFPGR